MRGGQGRKFEDSERRGAEVTRGEGEICGDQGGNFEYSEKVFGQKGGEFEEKGGALEETRMIAVKEEKIRKKAEEERVKNYCKTLWDMKTGKLGFKSKEWKPLDGCWYKMMDKAYIAYWG